MNWKKEDRIEDTVVEEEEGTEEQTGDAKQAAWELAGDFTNEYDKASKVSQETPARSGSDCYWA